MLFSGSVRIQKIIKINSSGENSRNKPRKSVDSRKVHNIPPSTGFVKVIENRPACRISAECRVFRKESRMITSEKNPLMPLIHEDMFNEAETHKDPCAAMTIKALRARQRKEEDLDPWLCFPQHDCCFAFGPRRQPLPVGALERLWDGGGPFVQSCPKCGGPSYAVSFGGLLTIGGLRMVCTTCGISWGFPLDGGLVGVARFLNTSPLAGTEYQPTAMTLGSAFASKGRELRTRFQIKAEPVYGMGFDFKMEAADLPPVLLGCQPSRLRIEPPLRS
jgi:hypothetical protein